MCFVQLQVKQESRKVCCQGFFVVSATVSQSRYLADQSTKIKKAVWESQLLFILKMFCLHDYGKVMQLMQFTVSGSRWKVQLIKRCFVLLRNCVSRPFSVAFNAWSWQCGKQRRKVEVGSAVNGSRFLAACPPHGLLFPCSLQAAPTKGADSFRRSWIPLSHKSCADRSFSQGL